MQTPTLAEVSKAITVLTACLDNFGHLDPPESVIYEAIGFLTEVEDDLGGGN